jgi:hypothetical protein
MLTGHLRQQGREAGPIPRLRHFRRICQLCTFAVMGFPSRRFFLLEGISLIQPHHFPHQGQDK